MNPQVSIDLKDLVQLQNERESYKDEVQCHEREYQNSRELNNELHTSNSNLKAENERLVEKLRSRNGDLEYQRGVINTLQISLTEQKEFRDAQCLPAKVNSESLESFMKDVGKPECKIKSIKLIREFTGLGLKEAKDLYERVHPSPKYPNNF